MLSYNLTPLLLAWSVGILLATAPQPAIFAQGLDAQDLDDHDLIDQSEGAQRHSAQQGNTLTGDNSATEPSEQTSSQPTNAANDKPSSSLSSGSISDLLIVLDTDGRSHTAQHTIASNGSNIQIRLPGSVIPQEIQIFSAKSQQQREQFLQRTENFTLNNGVAFLRYQHQYGSEVTSLPADQFILKAHSIPTSIDANNLDRSMVTWVFPNTYELVDFSAQDESIGRWIVDNNSLSFQQNSNQSVPLVINYKRSSVTKANIDSDCSIVGAKLEECSDDLDNDGVPDYRDICSVEVEVSVNSFGCELGRNILLESVAFARGRSYLNVDARLILDKTATALTHVNTTNAEQLVEIGSHTDSAGADDNNLQLSQKRADAVRQYLILRGVPPNSIKAIGYGEQYPIADNAIEEGRQSNRRVELVIIN